MHLAIAQAREAAAGGNFAAGAVIVMNGRVVATGRNQARGTGDPTAHAEMVALRAPGTVLHMMAGLHRVELVEGILADECRALVPEASGFE